MALIKQINYKGVDAEYWKISSHQPDCLRNRTLIKFCLYVSKAVRQENVDNYLNQPTDLFISIPGYFENRENCYTELKEHKIRINNSSIVDFSDAVND